MTCARRSPGLRNHAEAALAFGGDAATYRQALEKTIEESDQLIRIFNALLLIARAEAGGDLGPLQPFDVGEAARSVAELYEPIAEEEGVELTVRAEDGLTVRGNRELIGQAIANLVDNALKYGAPQKGVGDAETKPEVAITARRAGRSVVLTVADRGPGIAPADRARVLDRFVRLEGSRSRPGSGLRTFARRRGRAHAWRNSRPRGQSARASRAPHLAGGGRPASIAGPRRPGLE